MRRRRMLERPLSQQLFDRHRQTAVLYNVPTSTSVSFVVCGESMTEKPSTTLPGTVEKIIKSPIPGEPEKAEITVEGAEDLYKEIRIENTLTDEDGNEVRLKKGAKVEVHVEADPQATLPKTDSPSSERS
jgi:hypothetical protein